MSLTLITAWYTIAEFGDEATRFETTWDPTEYPKYAIEEAAEDHFNNHDGWESRWPLTFILVSDQGTEIARSIVQREDEPHFYAAIDNPEQEKV